MKDFADYLRGELGRKESTIRAYLARLKELERDIGKPVNEITVQDLRDFKLRNTTLKRESVKARLVALRALHEWAVIEGLDWASRDMRLVKIPRINDAEPQPGLTREKAVAIRDACQLPVEFRLVYLGLYAGTRIGEAAAVSGHHWQDGMLLIRTSKTDKPRRVPIHPDLARPGGRRGDYLRTAAHKGGTVYGCEAVEKEGRVPLGLTSAAQDVRLDDVRSRRPRRGG